MKAFPKSSYNPISLLGAGFALFALAAIVILYFMDNFAHGSNPYLGAVLFFLFPAVLVFGLLLIPVGMWRERRRKDRTPITIDFGKAQHRNAALLFVVGTSIFLFLTTLGMYGGYEYMESNSFCGEVCHAIMEPEFVAHQAGVHAEVHCVECHIRPGADWYMKAKLNGARQLVEAVRGTYHKPVPTPVEVLPPDEVVCLQCHWTQKRHHSPGKVVDYFLGDRNNTHWQIKMLNLVGGPSADLGEDAEGAHWHLDQEITYVAADRQRLIFDQVTWVQDGETRVYTRSGAPLPADTLAAREAEHRLRTMACLDCHNRPAHRFVSPMKAVDQAMAAGRISPETPWIKRQAVLALSNEFETVEGALASIDRELREFYDKNGIPLPEASVEEVKRIYTANTFPGMRVRWDRYPEHNGHLESPGCFRCHGSDLRTAAGETISNECNLCHLIVDQGRPELSSGWVALAGSDFHHPINVDDPDLVMRCTECHVGDGAVYEGLLEADVEED